MRLTDLSPTWLVHEGQKVGFLFLCPHCRHQWLSCMFMRANDLPRDDEGFRGDRAVFAAALKELGIKKAEDVAWEVVGCNGNSIWRWMGDSFENLTCKPSLDASASGHWHGHITNGAIA